MIEPFEKGEKRPGKVSYGLSSMGYDFRLSDEFLIQDPVVEMDPKNYPFIPYLEEDKSRIVIPGGATILGKSVEYFRIPDDVIAFCYGKSTYARLGILINMTPIEPGWCGNLTISISNVGQSPVAVYAHEGIGQMVFHQADEVPLATYATKQGKYQNADGIRVAEVD